MSRSGAQLRVLLVCVTFLTSGCGADGEVEGICTLEGCNDNEPCTLDSCGKAHTCNHLPTEATCTDGNVCTSGDHCFDSECIGGPRDCNDQNPCTVDSCAKPGGCAYIPSDVSLCDDSDACSEDDHCKNGACISTKNNPCEDGNLCTTDLCDKASGCDYQATAGGCSDNNICTIGDNCANTLCVPGTKKSCDDGNPCTIDACDVTTGCYNTMPTGKTVCGLVCSDLKTDALNCGKCGKACAPEESCNGGICLAIKCIPKAKVPCFDGDPGTLGVGLCREGTRTCNDDGTGWATACEGQVLAAAAEDCSTPGDDNCNGVTNEAALCGLPQYKFNIETNCGAACYYDEPHNIAINGAGGGGNNNGYDKYASGQLVDGLRGADDWFADLGKGPAWEWVAWSTPAPSITVQFPKARVLALVRLGFNNKKDGTVSQPPEIQLRFGTDGVTWTPVQKFKLEDGTAPTIPDGVRGDIVLAFAAKTVKYVEIHFVTPGTWTFVDELEFD